MKKLSMLVITICLFTMSSCKKYDEGGLISKADENIIGTWKLQSYFRNGTDETSQLIISSYQETYSEGKVLSRSYIDGEGEADSDTGSWELISDGAEVKIDGVGSADMTADVSSISSSKYNILKLTDDEYWYSFVNGGDTHELRLKK